MPGKAQKRTPCYRCGKRVRVPVRFWGDPKGMAPRHCPGCVRLLTRKSKVKRQLELFS